MAQNEFKVMKGYEVIDTVFYDELNPNEVKRSLVAHDDYDPEIRVIFTGVNKGRNHTGFLIWISDGGYYAVECKNVKMKAPDWDGKPDPERIKCHHILSVTNVYGERLTFDYWASLAEPTISRKKDGILSAVSCFLMDSRIGSGSFKDYCDDYGVDEDSRKSYRVWEACQQSGEDAGRVFTEADMTILSDFFSELGF